MSYLPGWNSLDAVTRYHNWAELIGIGVLALLVVAELLTFFYGGRKDHLTDQNQKAAERAHQEQIARLQFDTASANDRAAEATKQTALTEERLLNERRLTANERWRLERVEHAALARTTFFDFKRLIAELKAGHFSPTNIVVVNRPEPRAFALALNDALQEAQMAGAFLIIPDNGNFSGVQVATENNEGHRLQQLLWNRFRIAGSPLLPTLRPIAARFPELAPLPVGTNSIIVGENDAALQPGAGQHGEGMDGHGGPDPAPH